MLKIAKGKCIFFPLVLKRKWYDMIAQGVKREEYRDFTPRYQARFRNFQRRCNDAGCVDTFGKGLHGKPVAVVAFSCAYTKPDLFYTVMLQPVEDKTLSPIDIAAIDERLRGRIAFHRNVVCVSDVSLRPEWGEPDGKHFVIRLAERVEFE